MHTKMLDNSIKATEVGTARGSPDLLGCRSLLAQPWGRQTCDNTPRRGDSSIDLDVSLLLHASASSLPLIVVIELNGGMR